MSEAMLGLVPSRYQHLPSPVVLGIYRVEANPLVRRLLTPTFTRILQDLVSRVDRSNGAVPIRVRNDRVADTLDVNEKTVRRCLAHLTNLGWLKTATDGRSEWGLYTYKEYQLTSTLCELLHLPVRMGKRGIDESETPTPEVDVLEKSEESRTASSEEETVHINSTLVADKYFAFSAETTDQRNSVSAVSKRENTESGTKMSIGTYIDLSFKKDLRKIWEDKRQGNPIHLSVELQRIAASCEIAPSGICKLQGIARAVGHRLEDVWAVAKTYVVERLALKKGRAFSYLHHMLLAPVDYAKKADMIRVVAEQDVERNDLVSDRSRYAFKRYSGPHGMRVRIFDGSAEIMLGNGTIETRAGENMKYVYQAIKNGSLKEIAD